MSQAPDWIVRGDQDRILIDLTGFGDLNDRHMIGIDCIDGYDEETRQPKYNDHDGFLEGGMHLPADRTADPSKQSDFWGFLVPIIGIPQSEKTKKTAKAQAQAFLPIKDMGLTPDSRMAPITLASGTNFDFCDRQAPIKSATSPKGSKDFASPHNFVDPSAPMPLGTPLLLSRATEELSLEYIAFRAWQNMTIAHHRGKDDPDFSTRLVDITDKGIIDQKRIAGFHSALKVEDGFGPHCGASLFWGVLPDEPDIARGMFSTSGQFGNDPKNKVVGFAGESGGGPISAGSPDFDRHLVGFDRDGNPINQGHLWLGAPWYVDKEHDAPPAFDKRPYGNVQNTGTPWEVTLHHDDERLHPILGLNAAGGVALGEMRWRTNMPFLIPPLVDPPPVGEPEDFNPPWWNPRDPGRKPPRKPEPPKNDPKEPKSPEYEVGPKGPIEEFIPRDDPREYDVDPPKGPIVEFTPREQGPAEYEFEPKGPIEEFIPDGEYGFGNGGLDEFGFPRQIQTLEDKYQDPRPLESTFARMVSPYCEYETPQRQSIDGTKHLWNAIFHWLEQRPTSLAFAPIHTGQIDRGEDDLRYTRQPSKNDIERRIKRAPIACRLEAFGAENINDFDLINKGCSRNAFADVKGGLSFLPPNRGIGDTDIGETPETYFNFDGTSSSWGTPKISGDNAGGIESGFSRKLAVDKTKILTNYHNDNGDKTEIEELTFDGILRTEKGISSQEYRARVRNSNFVGTLAAGKFVKASGYDFTTERSQVNGITSTSQTPLGIVNIALDDAFGTLGTDQSGDIQTYGPYDAFGLAGITLAAINDPVYFDSSGNPTLSAGSIIVGRVLDPTDSYIFIKIEEGASGGVSPDNFSIKEILGTETITIPARQQMIIVDGITITGTLIIDGELELL